LGDGQQIPSHTLGRDGGGCAEGLPRRRERDPAQEQAGGAQRVGHGGPPDGGCGGSGGGRSRVARRDLCPEDGLSYDSCFVSFVCMCFFMSLPPTILWHIFVRCFSCPKSQRNVFARTPSCRRPASPGAGVEVEVKGTKVTPFADGKRPPGVWGRAGGGGIALKALLSDI